MKRTVSVFLALILLLSAFTALPAAAANSKTCSCEHTPMIYVYGRQDIFDDPASPDRKIISGYDAVWMKDTIMACYDLHKTELTVGSYDNFCDDLVDRFSTQYKDFVCDDAGKLPKNRSGVDWSWSPQTLQDDHKNDNVYSYVFIYDARKDPFVIADELNAYVEAVRSVTGHRKVAILSRCMGTDMALAYFQKYGWNNIDTFFTYSSAAQGTTIFSELFAGKFKLDLNSLSNYLTEQRSTDPLATESADITLLRTLLDVLQAMNALGLPSAACNMLIEKVRTNALPRILRASFATSPGYWSMVSPEDYEQAKTFLFGNSTRRYAKLISKIDNYNLQVRQPMKDLLTRMQADGVKLCILAKYGFQLIPMTESRNTQSDDKITMTAQSFGATGAEYGKTLSVGHILLQTLKGKGGYISPDRIIDASTCWFPEVTWFVKNIRHNDFPGQFYDFVVRLVKSDRQLTIHDDPAFPQFTAFVRGVTGESWSPMSTGNLLWSLFARSSVVAAIFSWFQTVRTFLHI